MKSKKLKVVSVETISYCDQRVILIGEDVEVTLKLKDQADFMQAHEVVGKEVPNPFLESEEKAPASKKVAKAKKPKVSKDANDSEVE